MKISVVIPTYKRPELLLRCLHALYVQNIPADEYEIIVVSDGQDTTTQQALERFTIAVSPRLHYLQLPEKKGPAAARNAGWRAATGELIVFTDDDCIPDRDWLATFWHAYIRWEFDPVALSGNTIVPISEDPTDYEVNISHLSNAEFITANCACSKSAMVQTGGFDEKFTMAWREDSDLQFKFIKSGIPVIRIPDATVIHPVRKARWGVSLKEERKGLFDALLYKKFPLLFRKKIQSQRPWRYYAILGCFILLIVGAVLHLSWLVLVSIITWLTLTASFIFRRLRNTSHSPTHIGEIIVTSIAIPFLSLYWRWYGASKYRVLFI